MFQIQNMTLLTVLSVAFAGILTFTLLKCFSGKLPKDVGKEFAHDGELSAGRPRGAGLIFILSFAFVVLFLVPFQVDYLIYTLLVVAAMVTGFLDDAATIPWGGLKKGLLDLLLAVVVAWTYYNFSGTTICIPFVADPVTLHPVVFFLLAIILVWVSINVTNCTDGVDGLSGTLGIITLGAMFFLVNVVDSAFSTMILIMIACLLGYLWFNATPNLMMMGDAGSRALGIFIAIAALKTGTPFLYIPLALLFILDGGLGLIKVSLLRFLKIKIMVNIRTPIHDHMRKNMDWSNTQVVFRFVIIQILISFVVIALTLYA